MSAVLVSGGRDFDDRDRVFEALDEVAPSRIVTGDAPGADFWAVTYAMVHRLPCRVFEADWDWHGRAAGPIRNQQMLDEGNPDLVVAFPGGRGTADMVRRARKAGIPVMEVGK